MDTNLASIFSEFSVDIDNVLGRKSLEQSLSILFKHMLGLLWYSLVGKVVNCMTSKATSI